MKPDRTDSAPIRILVVEDNPGDIRLIEEMLKEEPFTATSITQAKSLAAAIKEVAGGGIDVVLLDLGLPDSRGIDTFLELEKRAAQLPIIVLSGLGDEGVVRQAVQHRVQDYLIKGQVQGRTLMRSIRYAIDRKAAEAALRESAERYRRQSAALAALVEVAQTISQTLNLEIVLTRALDAIARQRVVPVEEQRGGVFVVEGDRLKLAAYKGKLPSGCPARDHDLRPGECLCGMAAQTGELAASCHVAQRGGFAQAVTLAHGHAIVPLKSSAKVVGMLYLYLPVDTVLADDQLELLDAIGSQLAVVIENSLLFEEIKALSLHDPLTGLANRRLMYFQLAKGIAGTKRDKELAAIMIDIDSFKSFNDSFGHAAGDRVLIEIAHAILAQVRAVDLAARLGGDEFLVILADTPLTAATNVAERIRAGVAALAISIGAGQEPINATISLGVAAFGSCLSDSDDLIKRCDSLLYQAKTQGGNRVEACSAPA